MLFNCGNNTLNSKKLIALIVFVLFITNSIAITMAYLAIKNNYEELIKNTKVNSHNIALMMEKTIGSTLDKTNLILSGLISQSNVFKSKYLNQDKHHENTKQIVDSFLNTQSFKTNEIHGIGIVDSQNQLIYKNNEFITCIFGQIKNNLVLSKTEELALKPVKVNNINYMVLTKSSFNKEGQIEGWVFSVIKLDYFYSILAKANIGENSTISLNNSDFYNIKDSVFKTISIGSLKDYSFLENFDNNKYTNGFVDEDTSSKLYYYEKISLYPLYLVVGVDKETMIQPWKEESLRIIITTLSLLFLSCIGSILVFNAWNKLNKNDKQLKIILDSTEDAIYGTDLKGNCIFCNSACVKLLGYDSESELLGQNMYNLVNNDSIKSFLLNNGVNSGIKIEGQEGEFYKKDGNLIPVYYSAMPQYNENGNVVGTVLNFYDVSYKKKTNAVIWKQANYDTLTNLPNRLFFNQQLTSEIQRNNISDSTFAVMFIDLDNFKDVNDSLGHEAGDLLLKEVAVRLQNCVRRTDTVARFGGDEFTVLLRDIPELEVIDNIAKNILNELTSKIMINGVSINNIGASIGITVYPKDCLDTESILKNADQAMYVAKDSGKNCYRYFNKDMDKKLHQRLELYHDLKEAILHNQFEIYLQPIVNLKTDNIIKAESLIRWNHPTKGMINPAEFIPAAEEIGLIVELGDWVFKNTVDWLQKVRNDPLYHNIHVSINVSPIQFKEQNLVSNWKTYVDKIGLNPKYLVLEITESLLLSDSSDILDKIKEFRALGFAIAIDDFGTGYSAMSYLYKYDIDYIKIDKSFIDHIDEEGNKNTTIVEILLLMANKLNIKVIAEGIESVGQLNILRNNGCDYGQGYYYSRPISTTEFEKLLLISK